MPVSPRQYFLGMDLASDPAEPVSLEAEAEASGSCLATRGAPPPHTPPPAPRLTPGAQGAASGTETT